MSGPDLNTSKFIDIMTGRSRSPFVHQSEVETIRVPGQDHLVLVDTPGLTWFGNDGPDSPPELDIIKEWLKMMCANVLPLNFII